MTLSAIASSNGWVFATHFRGLPRTPMQWQGRDQAAVPIWQRSPAQLAKCYRTSRTSAGPEPSNTELPATITRTRTTLGGTDNV